MTATRRVISPIEATGIFILHLVYFGVDFPLSLDFCFSECTYQTFSFEMEADVLTSHTENTSVVFFHTSLLRIVKGVEHIECDYHECSDEHPFVFWFPFVW
jgi:hypothetical protein